MKLNEIKRSEIPSTREEVEKWTEADWDELWENPTVEKVLTWCRGNNAYDGYVYMKKTSEKQVSISNGRVNFNTHFQWRADRDRLPFKLGKIKGDFRIWGFTAGDSDSRLKTSEGFPTQVGGNVKVWRSAITKFDEFPQVVKGNIEIQDNRLLTTLKGLGHLTGKNLYLGECQIKSFDGAPTKLGKLDINSTVLTTLSGIHNHIHEINDLSIIAPIKSGMMDLLKISCKPVTGLSSVQGGTADSGDKNVYKAWNIIKKFMKPGGATKTDLIECQSQLDDADLEDYA